MSERIGIRPLSLLLLAGSLFLLACCPGPRIAPRKPKELTAGNYNVQQSAEVGYRLDWINGNQDTYDTFVNLNPGARLLDYTLNMRSLNHQGLLFDNLNFSNFGYGGDPNDVSRLRIEKNKWYDFSWCSAATSISGITTCWRIHLTQSRSPRRAPLPRLRSPIPRSPLPSRRIHSISCTACRITT